MGEGAKHGLFNWFNASFHCIDLDTGGRTGWHLPTIQELLSLVDRSQSNPSLPAGHPFTVQSSDYWSTTTRADDTTGTWLVGFGNGAVHAGGNLDLDNFRAWCVRGGSGVDVVLGH